jgi:hypothetical protein
MEDVDMFAEMRNCMSKMPWEELRGMGDGRDSSWFKSEVRDGDGSHLLAASQAPEIQPLTSPSISSSRLTLPLSNHQYLTNLDSGKIAHTREPEDITVDVETSTNIGLDGEAGIPSDAMDIDNEVSATNLQTLSRTQRRRKEIQAANLQIHKLRIKGAQPKPSGKGKKRAVVDDDEDDEDDNEDDEDDEDDEEEGEEENVSSSTQTHSQHLKKNPTKALSKVSRKTQTTSLSIS